VVLASFTSVYLPTLSTVTTIVALLTVYLARRDRSEEQRATWQRESRARLQELADALVNLIEVARSEHLRMAAANPLAKPDESKTQIPSVMVVPRMRLFAALAGVPLPAAYDKVWKLHEASQAEVIRDGQAALDQIVLMLDDMTVMETQERLRKLNGRSAATMSFILDLLRMRKRAGPEREAD
jgi:hypothetical protein